MATRGGESIEVRVARLEEQQRESANIAALHRQSDQDARALLKEQNDRHFETLNHEAARIVAAQSVSVTREKFDLFAESVNKFQNAQLSRQAAVAAGAAVAWWFISKLFASP